MTLAGILEEGERLEREAKRLRAALGLAEQELVLYRDKSATLHRQSADLPFGEFRAALVDEDGATGAGNDIIELAVSLLNSTALSRLLAVAKAAVEVVDADESEGWCRTLDARLALRAAVRGEGKETT